MQRTTSKAVFNENAVRWKTKVVSDPCGPDSILSKEILSNLLHSIADNMSIVACGLAPFERMLVYHNTEAWVIEADAIIAKDKVAD